MSCFTPLRCAAPALCVLSLPLLLLWQTAALLTAASASPPVPVNSASLCRVAFPNLGATFDLHKLSFKDPNLFYDVKDTNFLTGVAEHNYSYICQ
jgi:hypothetical protein